jgi:GNAT superfamily N-acetyltransferase
MAISIPAVFPFDVWHPEFRELYLRRLAAGHAAVCCHCGGILVHVSWIAFEALRIDEVARTWRFAAGECCVYDVITLPAARGRGIYPAVLRWICGHAAGEGLQSVWIYADARNTASARGIRSAGFTQAGTIRAFRVWKRPLITFGHQDTTGLP